MAESGALYLARERVELLGESADQGLDRLVRSQAATVGLWNPQAPPEPHRFWSRVETTPPGEAAEQRWPAENNHVLRAGGWYPGRSIPTGTWESVLRLHGGFEMHDAARCFLAEFGGVQIPFREPWNAMPWREFRLDPLLALWDDEILEDLSEQAGTCLYPIGMIDRRSQYLGLAQDGSVYVGMDSVGLLAATPDEAVATLTARIRTR